MEIVENQTRKRLEQIKTLFNQLKYQFEKNDFDNFDISLNNFVMNSRTITFLLKKEFGKYHNFKKWYEPKMQEMKNKGYEKFVILRNALEKEGDLRKAMFLHINVTSSKEKDSRILTSELDEKGKKKNPIYGKFEMKPLFRIDDLNLQNLDKTAITDCEDYLTYLTSLVEEAYKKFKGN